MEKGQQYRRHNVLQVELIYRDGRFHLTQPLKLKHEGVKIVVHVPDEEIDTAEKITEQPDAVQRRAGNLRKCLDQILDAEMPDDFPLPPVSAKSKTRIQAFSSRKGK
jgi:predicted DNA-binding antitoxin AbrB/MazE fold protein